MTRFQRAAETTRIRIFLACAALVCVGCAGVVARNHEVLKPVTDDMVTLELKRYLPENPDPGKAPVLMIHGMGANGLNFSFPGRSLAEYLAADGYDCFVAELRGDPASKPAPDRGRYGFDLDDYIVHDMPALLDAVQQATGARKINLIGHSMGGVIIGCHLARFGDDRAMSIVIVASPFAYKENTDLYSFAARHLSVIHRLPTFRTGPLGRPYGMLLADLDLRAETFLYNPENISAGTVRGFGASGLSNVSSGVLAQFADNMAEGSNRTFDRGFDYSAGLSKVTVPSLWIAGKRDEICQPVNVRLSYETAGGTDKTYFLAGRANGLSMDYGHGDLLAGEAAPEEIFPLISAWLDKRQR